jgi:glycosyltransferase involved in cell wall biosynthesis
MRVGIGISGIAAPNGMGSAQYALLRGLSELGDKNEFILFGKHADIETICNLPHFEFKIVDLLGTTAAMRFQKLDIFHGLTYFLPTGRSCKTVVTTHDTLLVTNIEQRPEQDQWFKFSKRMIPLCARRASRVITVSQYAREQIASEFSIPIGKIDVVYNGISSEFAHFSDRNEAYDYIHQLGIACPYLLYVGGISPRKNLKTLIAAFDLLRRVHTEAVRLVIVNGIDKKGLLDEELRMIFSCYPDLCPKNWNGYAYQSSSVIVTGSLTIRELVSLYNLAEVFVYPSLAEGFGLPPIEAMACGTPVVASNRTSLPEILGEAALLVDPLDIPQFTSTIWEVLKDQGIAYRMITKGLNHSKKYSEKNMALNTINVYEKIMTSQTLHNLSPLHK